MSATHHRTTLDAAEVTIGKGSILHKLPVIGFIVGIAAIAGAYFMGQEHHQFFFSYLVAFAFALSIALGSLFFVMVQFAARGAWSIVVRRISENLMGTLPIFVLLFIPIALGMHDLYHWTHAELYDPTSANYDAILAGKESYLNTPFFFIRAGLYFFVWIALSQYFFRMSRRQDTEGGEDITVKLRKWSALGIALYAFTQTFAAVDWYMSLDPHWYSTMFGVYYFAGSFMVNFAVLSIISLRLSTSDGVLHGIVNAEHRHDLGKHLFAFNIFWAYIAFSQYFLIWYANIPEETLFFAHRFEGGWEGVGILLMVGHFGFPFLALMAREMKRSRKVLMFMACWMLFMHYVDMYYIIMPMNSAAHGFHPSLVDLLALIGVGSIFVAVLSKLLTSAPVVPVKDPRLPESLAFENF